MPWAQPYLSTYGGSKQAQLDLFNALAAQYPSLVRREKLDYNYAQSGLPMYMFRVGNFTGGKLLCDGAIHGCSDISTLVYYYFLKDLLEANARVLAGSTEYWDIRRARIIQYKQLLFVPIVNWCSVRKNGQNPSDPNYGGLGVNINRNYSYSWSSAGSSISTNTDYRGPSAASEPETKNMKNLFTREIPEVYLSFHNWGGLMFSSYNNTSAQITFSTQIANAYTTIRNQMGITDTIYNFNSGGLGAGMSASDAALTAGIKAAFIVEITRTGTAEDMNHPPQNNTDIPYPPIRFITGNTFVRWDTGETVTGYYRRVLPILLAMAEAVSDGGLQQQWTVNVSSTPVPVTLRQPSKLSPFQLNVPNNTVITLEAPSSVTVMTIDSEPIKVTFITPPKKTPFEITVNEGNTVTLQAPETATGMIE